MVRIGIATLLFNLGASEVGSSITRPNLWRRLPHFYLGHVTILILQSGSARENGRSVQGDILSWSGGCSGSPMQAAPPPLPRQECKLVEVVSVKVAALYDNSPVFASSAPGNPFAGYCRQAEGPIRCPGT